MNRKIEFYEELPGTVGNSQIENTRSNFFEKRVEDCVKLKNRILFFPFFFLYFHVIK